MQQKRIIILLLTLTILPIITLEATALEIPLSVYVDKNIYDKGDTIVIYGNAEITNVNDPVVVQIIYEGEYVYSVLVPVAKNSKYSKTIIAERPLLVENGIYTISVTHNGEIAETQFYYLNHDIILFNKGVIQVTTASNETFDIKYIIIGGGSINNIQVYSTFVVQLDEVERGNIKLNLPRELIDAKKQNGEDDVFIVLVNEAETSYQESLAYPGIRTLKIDLEKDNSHIEIIGTFIAN